MRELILSLNDKFGAHENFNHTMAANEWYAYEYGREGSVAQLKLADVSGELVKKRVMEAVSELNLSSQEACNGIIPIPYIDAQGNFNVRVEVLPALFLSLLSRRFDCRLACVREGEPFTYKGELNPITHTPSDSAAPIVNVYLECRLKTEPSVTVCSTFMEEEFKACRDVLIEKQLNGLTLSEDIYENLMLSLICRRARDTGIGCALMDDDALYQQYYQLATYGFNGFDEETKADPNVYSSWGKVIATKTRVFSDATRKEEREMEEAIYQAFPHLRPQGQGILERSLRLVVDNHTISDDVFIDGAVNLSGGDDEVATEWGQF